MDRDSRVTVVIAVSKRTGWLLETLRVGIVSVFGIVVLVLLPS